MSFRSKGCHIIQIGAVPIAMELCKQARIQEILNQYVQWRKENTSISPGFLIETLVVCLLCDRRPLWKVQQFWMEQDWERLFNGTNITPDQLNDDAYGHALEKLAMAPVQQIMSLISLALLHAHDLTISQIHLDTTSKSVQGNFEGSALVKYGFSKDKRNDLKQIKIGLATQQNGLPIAGKVLAGNCLDTEWNIEAVEWMHQFFTEQAYQEVIYVSDCALITKDNLKKLEDRYFISRLPETFGLANQLKKVAFENGSWSFHLDDYQMTWLSAPLEGTPYTFLVVHSKKLEKQKIDTIQRQVKNERTRIEKEGRQLSKQEFACETDALRMAKDFIQVAQQKGWSLSFTIEKIEKKSYEKKGRPVKTAQPTVVSSFSIHFTIHHFSEELYQKRIEQASTFVLIANVPEKMDGPMILQEYKHQNHVESRFRILKDPIYLGAVYLEKDERIIGLGYVFFLVLLILSYLEYRVRTALQEHQEYLLLPGKKKTQNPSVQTIMEVLSTISLLILNGDRQLPKPNHLQAYDMIRWAGFDLSIYTQNKTSYKKE